MPGVAIAASKHAVAQTDPASIFRSETFMYVPLLCARFPRSFRNHRDQTRLPETPEPPCRHATASNPTAGQAPFRPAIFHRPHCQNGEHIEATINSPSILRPPHPFCQPPNVRAALHIKNHAALHTRLLTYAGLDTDQTAGQTRTILTWTSVENNKSTERHAQRLDKYDLGGVALAPSHDALNVALQQNESCPQAGDERGMALAFGWKRRRV
jgi:hypothetical protein